MFANLRNSQPSLLQESAVRLLTEATQHYLETFCERLHQEQDREAALGQGGSGWPDILEKVRIPASRVSDPDPHGSALILVAGSGSGSRRAKITNKNRKSTEFSCFEVLDVLF